MRLLLDAGADANAQTQRGLTPLRMTLTAKPYSAAVIELLVARGADPDRLAAGGISDRAHAARVCHGADLRLLQLLDPPAR